MNRRLDPPARAALSRRALLLALHPDPSAFAGWVVPRAQDVDWQWALTCARTHKVAALLAARIEACGIGDALGAELREQVAEVRRDAARRGEIARQTISCLAEHYQRAGIPFFVVKGSVVAQHVYGDAALRRFSDVDVVVHRRDVERAEEVLRGLGFIAGGIEQVFKTRPRDGAERQLAERLTRRFDAQRLAAFSWHPPRGGELVAVDLHWHIAPYRLHIAEEEIWQQTTPVEVGATRVLTLNAPATLIHLALHATTCTLNGFRLLHLCDVGWTAPRLAEQQDAVWRLAAAWGVAAHLGVVFHTVERGLGIAIPFAAINNRAANSAARPLLRSVASEDFLLAAPEQVTRPALVRIWSEFAWSVTMGCLRRNVVVVCHVWWARLRLQLARWRRG